MNNADEAINQLEDASIGVTPDERLPAVGPGPQLAARVDVEWCLVHDALLHGGSDRCVVVERGDGAKSFVRCASVALYFDRAEAARRSDDWQRTQSGRTRR